MDRDFSNLGPWLNSKLDQAGLSVERLAVKAGISRASIYFYIQDRCRPTESNIKRICDALGVPFEEGLQQYTPRKPGRKSRTSVREVHVHNL